MERNNNTVVNNDVGTALDNKGVRVLDEKELLRKILKDKGWSQYRFAKECGYKHQSSIEGFLSRNVSIRLDTLTTLLDVLGWDLYAKDRESGEEVQLW